jgi:hypothetical protein
LENAELQGAEGQKLVVCGSGESLVAKAGMEGIDLDKGEKGEVRGGLSVAEEGRGWRVKSVC